MILSFHLLSACFFPITFLALLLAHAMQEIQDGHNGYHSEAEADQVASLTPLLFITYVEVAA